MPSTLDWDLRLQLDPDSPDPVYLRVAHAIADEIRRGRLGVGAPLPGTRRLAQSLGIHRNTAVAAFRELAADGWIDTRPGSGTFVSRGPANSRPSADDTRVRAAVPAVVPYALRRLKGAFQRRAPDPPGVLAFSHLPDPTSAPAVAIARAYRRALRRNAAESLDYANRGDTGAPFGHSRLRAALAAMLTQTRGLVTGAANVLITNGSQMALYLAAQALVEPGDVIAVEALGYRPAWEAFRFAGAALRPIPVDGDGMRVEDLRALASHTRVRAVYVTPHRQHPTTVTLSRSRRRALLEFAREAGVAVIEDDYDSEFNYDGAPALPLASSDRTGSVVYVGSLSKVLAPGLRIGYAVAPTPMLDVMAERRCFIDRQGDHVLGCAVAEMLEDGELQRHARRVRALYGAQREALADALTAELGGAVSFALPGGGTAIWARVADDIDVEAWREAAVRRGAAFPSGRAFAFDDAPRPYARFGFAGLSGPRLQEAVRRAAVALADQPVRRDIP